MNSLSSEPQNITQKQIRDAQHLVYILSPRENKDANTVIQHQLSDLSVDNSTLEPKSRNDSPGMLKDVSGNPPLYGVPDSNLLKIHQPIDLSLQVQEHDDEDEETEMRRMVTEFTRSDQPAVGVFNLSSREDLSSISRSKTVEWTFRHSENQDNITSGDSSQVFDEEESDVEQNSTHNIQLEEDKQEFFEIMKELGHSNEEISKLWDDSQMLHTNVYNQPNAHANPKEVNELVNPSFTHYEEQTPPTQFPVKTNERHIATLSNMLFQSFFLKPIPDSPLTLDPNQISVLNSRRKYIHSHVVSHISHCLDSIFFSFVTKVTYAEAYRHNAALETGVLSHLNHKKIKMNHPCKQKGMCPTCVNTSREISHFLASRLRPPQKNESGWIRVDSGDQRFIRELTPLEWTAILCLVTISLDIPIHFLKLRHPTLREDLLNDEQFQFRLFRILEIDQRDGLRLIEQVQALR
ncbi:hypothetical protein BLNAU_6285 [Blattamonas nauphoetae]|uniref:Uncharacterized protein n=1 Tax=Blattamonas nauphoetae TaxID=2049346 RepID=A0ABQ9Y4V8_9EUKA|nr:hypothetical protein BLNAU_6285 [Blattamonas nauphoetae]